MTTPFKNLSLKQKLWISRYYLRAPYDILLSWFKQRHIPKVHRLSFRQIKQIVTRTARYKMGKRNYR